MVNVHSKHLCFSVTLGGTSGVLASRIILLPVYQLSIGISNATSVRYGASYERGPSRTPSRRSLFQTHTYSVHRNNLQLIIGTIEGLHASTLHNLLSLAYCSGGTPSSTRQAVRHNSITRHPPSYNLSNRLARPTPPGNKARILACPIFKPTDRHHEGAPFKVIRPNS